MVDYTKKLGMCLIMAASLCVAACGDDTTQPGEQGCTSNADCKDEALPVCNTDTGKCEKAQEEPPVTEDKCTSNADCKDEALPVCNTDTGKCEKAPEEPPVTEDKCTSDADCKDSSLPHCNTDTGKCEVDPGNGPGTGEEGGNGENSDVTECEDQALTPCGDEKTCVNLLTDNDNCGACGNKCTDNKTCQGGECKITCTDGTVLCDTECLDLDSAKTCGTCDNHVACKTAEGEACKDNQCQSICTKEGEVFCNNECVDFKSNPAHCGSCGHACDDGQVCSNGTCTTACDNAGDINCDGSCINPKENHNYCGAELGNQDGVCINFEVCGDGQTCNDGKCECATEGDSVCQLSDESKICTNPMTDSAHCGCKDERAGGGVNCNDKPGIESATCAEGVCVLKCDATHADCNNDPEDGCEVDLTDPKSCGTCENECKDDNADPDKTVCNVNESDLSQSTCGFTCKEGMDSCNGHCIDTLNDDNNCGWCGNKCGADAHCNNGFCTIQKDCDADNFLSLSYNNQTIKAYCITNENELRLMRDAINAKKAFAGEDVDASKNVNNAYIIMEDLVLKEDNWIPIGKDDSIRFTNGFFFGNGHLIEGQLKTTTGFSGLFGVVDKSVLDGVNLKLDLIINGNSNTNRKGALASTIFNTKVNHCVENGSITENGCEYNGAQSLGGLFGYVVDSKIDRSSTNVVIKANGNRRDYIGGMAGYLERSEFTNCSSTVDIDVAVGTSTGVGGLIGYINNKSKVENCSAKGKINYKAGSEGVGGLIGYIYWNSDVLNSRADVDVSASKAIYVGGLIGRAVHPTNPNGTPHNITNCHTTGNIVGKNQVGGLIGRIYNTALSNCTTTGNVEASGDYVGGVVGLLGSESGYRSVVTNNVASGNVKGLSMIGGLYGDVISSDITGGHATGDVTSTTISCEATGGAIGRATSSKVSTIYATGNVMGGTRMGGLIGRAIGTNVEKSASMGNVTCTEFGAAVGEYAGGLAGVTREGSTWKDCFSTGDVSCGKQVGSAFGWGYAVTTITNVYSTGKVNGTANTGSIFGMYDAGAGKNLTLKNSYYWEELTSPVVGNDTTVSAYGFKYNDSDEAVLSSNEKRQLSTNLGVNWMNSACTLKSGPAKKVTIAMLKDLSSYLCQQ